MSVVVKIAVVEPSVIIRSGLLAVLKRLPAFEAEIVEIADLTQLISTLNWRKNCSRRLTRLDWAHSSAASILHTTSALSVCHATERHVLSVWA